VAEIGGPFGEVCEGEVRLTAEREQNLQRSHAFIYRREASFAEIITAVSRENLRSNPLRSSAIASW